MSNWRVDENALESIVVGAGILGTGGGGNAYTGRLMARKLLREGYEVEVIDLEDVADDWTLCTVGGLGAPTVVHEKLPRGSETTDATQALADHVGRPIDAVLPAEIGGMNSIEPMVVAARLGIPVVDADGMGRAFPMLSMMTYLIYGVSPFPCALADDKGNQVIHPVGVDAGWLERLARVSTVEMGGFAGCALAYMSGADAKRTGIAGTLSGARRLGDRVRAERVGQGGDVLAGILEETGGRRMFEGKVVDIDRRTEGGWVQGTILIEGLGIDAGEQMSIEFQNEFLVARRNDDVVATVPDLICMVNRDDGDPITTEMIRYGYRVAVVGIPCSDMLRTPQALEVVGPPAFGYDLPFEPMEALR